MTFTRLGLSQLTPREIDCASTLQSGVQHNNGTWLMLHRLIKMKT